MTIKDKIRKINTVNIKHKRKLGSYGTYFQFGTIGLKLIKDDWFSPWEGETISRLKRQPCWKYAKKEFNIMKILRNSGFTPKPYCLKPIYEEESKFYYPGIFMQHFNGKEINSFKISKTTKKESKKLNSF